MKKEFDLFFKARSVVIIGLSPNPGNLGRNIWQNDFPVAMIKGIRAIVHQKATPSRLKRSKRELLAESTAIIIPDSPGFSSHASR
jgi:hypothetical protein